MSNPTAQEYYDLLVKSSQDGTFPSMNENGFCYYRGKRPGSKCAVGVLIPDGVLQGHENGISVTGLPDELVASIMPQGFGVINLRDVQRCHDDVAISALNVHSFSPRSFVHKLNILSCFDKVQKVDPNTLPEEVDVRALDAARMAGTPSTSVASLS